jgi:hypothetical protein
VVRPDLETCSQALRVVQPLGIRCCAPVQLTWDRNILYYADASGIQALPVDGRAGWIVAEAAASAFWIEGDDLLYVEGDDRLFSVPLSGGAPVPVADGQTVGVAPEYAWSWNQLLDDAYLYWDWFQQRGPVWSLWRMPRTGGAAEQLATLPPRDPTYAWPLAAATADSLLMALDSQGAAYAVPKSGGELRVLRPPPDPDVSPRLMGVGAAGVLWAEFAGPAHDGTLDSVYRVLVTDVGGAGDPGARPFWQEKPPTFQPLGLGAWPDRRGGWIVAGLERFSDDVTHQSIWSLDATGSGQRIACDASTVAGLHSSTQSVAFAPNVLYAIVGFASDQSSYFDYAIVEITAPATAPPSGS